MQQIAARATPRRGVLFPSMVGNVWLHFTRATVGAKATLCLQSVSEEISFMMVHECPRRYGLWPVHRAGQGKGLPP